MSEQQTTTPTATTANQNEPDTSEPTPDRQTELRAVYEANVAAGESPYRGVRIRTRGEVEWIIRERGWSTDFPLPEDRQSPDLREADLFGANLRGMDLSGANLHDANLRADLRGVNLQVADLGEADLGGADLRGANLDYADLRGADLGGTKLGEADLGYADLRGATLTEARLDRETQLSNAKLDAETRLGDIDWQSALLTRVPSWPKRLGDEQDIAEESTRQGRIRAYRNAARAYRNLSIALRAQGLLIPASDYRLRGQALERKASFQEGKLLGWTFSWLLNLVAGYGERPARSLVAYIVIICAFTGAYLLNAQFAAPHLTWDEALILSISAFHGRGFFTSGVSLGDTLARLAAGEAIIGLLIEITFIATFTQRFFAR